MDPRIKDTIFKNNSLLVILLRELEELKKDNKFLKEAVTKTKNDAQFIKEATILFKKKLRETK